MWLHQRLQVLGPVAWELIDWELTPGEADMLTEQLLELARHQQAVARRDSWPLSEN